jgi:hypothetical protein
MQTKNKKIRLMQCLSLLVLGLFLLGGHWHQMAVRAQIATTTATATLLPSPTIEGAYIYVPEQVNLRAAPGTDAKVVGVLIVGQQAKVLGRTPVGDWYLVEYPGAPDNRAWVFREVVQLRGADPDALEFVTPFPSQTPLPSETPLPGFNVAGTPLPTRLATFTAAPAVEPLVFPAADTPNAKFPPILVIAVLLIGALLAGLLGLLRRRN